MKINTHPIRLTSEKNWFHPSFCRFGEDRLLLTMLEYLGPDFYGAPVFAIGKSADDTFEEPRPIPPFAHRQREDGLVEAVADPRPFQLNPGSVVVFGCTTFYRDKGNAVYDPNIPLPANEPVYAVLGTDGTWSERMRLKVDGTFSGYRTACTQICRDRNGDWIVPFYAKKLSAEKNGAPMFFTITARYRFDGKKLVFQEKGNVLEIGVGRGFVEPSVCTNSDKSRFYLTLRAEDGHAYSAVSEDGLFWSDPIPWRWDDGTEIETSTTQQHWLKTGGKIYLAYTRKTAENAHIFRFRAPLYLAEADPERGVLIKRTESVVFPLRERDGEAAVYGNFHVTQLSDDHALISDSALFQESRTSFPMIADVQP